MNQAKKISLPIAIFMSINIVVGGGFFLSASNVFKTSGKLAPLGWLLCGALLLPLVLVLSDLSKTYPRAGGLYIYSRERLGEFWGFLSGWGYFVGTLAGNAIILHAFSSLSKKMGFSIPFLPHLSPLASLLIFDLFFLILFTIINLLNITILEKIHVGFTVLKLIPLGLVIVAMFFLFDFNNVAAAPIRSFGLIESLPTFIFAYLGIEACCSITHKIKDGKRNTTRAMIIALILITSAYALVQFGLLGILGGLNPPAGSATLNPFFNIIPKLTGNQMVISWGNGLVKLAILSSFLGGFYGMYYANAWNLYAIADEKKIIGSSILTKLNKHGTPWACILVQGLLVLFLLLVAIKSSTTLMTMSVFGVVIAYILSVLAYFKTRKTPTSLFVGSLALFTSLTLLALCVGDLFHDGLRYLVPFLGIILLGMGLYRRNL